MSLISSNKKENDLEESNTKSRNKLVKSSSTTVNNYSLYEKYIGKTNTSKMPCRYKFIRCSPYNSQSYQLRVCKIMH